MGETRDSREFGTDELPSKDAQIASLQEQVEKLTREREEAQSGREAYKTMLEQAEDDLAKLREGAEPDLADFIRQKADEYGRLIEAGQGQHGQPEYVRDATWYSWCGKHSLLAELVSRFGHPTTEQTDARSGVREALESAREFIDAMSETYNFGCEDKLADIDKVLAAHPTERTDARSPAAPGDEPFTELPDGSYERMREVEAMTPQQKVGLRNREAVRTLLVSHLGITRQEIAERLGMSAMAVGRHVTAIRSEWGGKSLPTKRGKK